MGERIPGEDVDGPLEQFLDALEAAWGAGMGLEPMAARDALDRFETLDDLDVALQELGVTDPQFDPFASWRGWHAALAAVALLGEDRHTRALRWRDGRWSVGRRYVVAGVAGYEPTVEEQMGEPAETPFDCACPPGTWSREGAVGAEACPVHGREREGQGVATAGAPAAVARGEGVGDG